MAALTADRFRGIRGLYQPPSLRRDARLDHAADALRRSFFDWQICDARSLGHQRFNAGAEAQKSCKFEPLHDRQSLCARDAEVTASVNRRTDIIRPAVSAERDFDTFLTHNSKDKPTARELKRVLEARGLTVWFDEDRLRPGLSWQPLLEHALQRAGSVVVALGGSGLGPWQNEETQLALNHAHALQRPVIPVLLPDCRDESALGGFLAGRTWVDLRGGFTEEQVARLIWGITGEKPALINSLPAGQNPHVRRWVLVAGSGGLTPRPSKIDEVSERLGAELATAGFSVVTGGWNGVDHNVARAFAERIEQNGQPFPADWCK